MIPTPTAHELLTLENALQACGLESYRESLAAVLAALTPEERSLFVDLTSRLSVCEIDKYLDRGASLAAQFVAGLKPNTKHVVLLPLLDPRKQRKSKSGEAVAWLMSRDLEARAKKTNRTFDMASRTLSSAMLTRARQSTFFLVDDFVGTGGTAQGAIEWLNSLGIPSANVEIGCFIGLKAGLDRIEQSGANAIFLEVLVRGISDAGHIGDKAAALKLMDRVGRRNKISTQYLYGYNKSEALALLCFCPNNTFPIFWWDGPAWKGPFTR